MTTDPRLRQAEQVAQKIDGIARDITAPLRLLLHQPGWTPEFCSIVFSAVRHELSRLELEMERAP